MTKMRPKKLPIPALLAFAYGSISSVRRPDDVEGVADVVVGVDVADVEF